MVFINFNDVNKPPILARSKAMVKNDTTHSFDSIPSGSYAKIITN